jgi:acetyl/propionyl-CoA carboxylase alpha subunit
MIASLLIANRGEIACRIIATCRRLDVRAIAVHSEADAHAMHVREADAAIAIGPAPARESYLVGANIIAAAEASGAEAIHPGYGFLSENAAFAEAVIAAGLIWVGPSPEAIRSMGLKDAAKRLMAGAGVGVTPGYLGEDQAPARLAKEALRIGYPVLIKAVAGGGGKGMRKVERAADFAAALAAAQREAEAAFGDARVLLETYVQRPRHIEVQVFGDAHGNVVHLFERDCSLQRRHQKVIEEAPAPGMDAATREAVCAAAVRAAQAVNYVGAGTVEFIADASDGLRADRIWFMEMNTRLQVEHPVTEEITGVDLVEWQLRIASGETLPLAQDEIALSGHAVEARLYAENPDTGFLPSTGPLDLFWIDHDGVRVDSGVEEGDEITPHYDPMIAKVIAHGETRAEAVSTLAAACASVEIWPVKTNAGFLARCLEAAAFRGQRIDTGFLAGEGADLAARPAPSAAAASLAANVFARRDARGSALRRRDDHASPWRELQGFRLNAEPVRTARLLLEGAPIAARVDAARGFAILRGDKAIVFECGEAFTFEVDRGDAGEAGGSVSDGAIRAPMPGKIVAVHAKVGEALAKGAPIFTLEAMKMEHVLTAPFEGALAVLAASAGAQVSEGAELARLERPS